MKKSVFSMLLGIVFCSALYTQLSAQSGGTNPQLIMYRYNNYPTQPAPVFQGDLLGTLRWNGLSAIGVGGIITGASIQSYATGPVSNGMLPANMVFRTGAPDQLNRMVITSEGLVGIGTMNPQFNLHTVGNTHTTGDFFGRIHMDENGGNPGPDTYTEEAYLEYKSGSALSAPDVSRGGLLTLAPSANQAGERDHQLFFNDGGIFHRWGDAPANTWAGMWHKLLTGEDIHGTENRLAKFTGPNSLGDSRLFDDGSRVGINNFAPAYDLDVTGTTRITGDAYVSGNVGIGTTTPGVKLDVNGESNFSGRMKIGATNYATGYALSVGGGIMAEEVRVQLQPWPDYVFENDYELMSLSSVEDYIGQHKHLPGVASAKEVAESGLDLGQTQKVQMEKIEEIFLHLIELEKRVQALESENKVLKAENEDLKAASGK